MQPDILKTKLHALQYQHVDGTFELTFGGASLLMAVGFYVISRISLTNSLIFNNLIPFIPLMFFVGGTYIIDTLVRHFRMQITYKRTGFIAYLKSQPIKRSMRLTIWVGIPILILTLLVLLFLNGSKFHTEGQDYVQILMPSFAGFMFSGLWMIVSWKLSIPRYYLIAAVSLLISTVLFLNGIGGNTGMTMLFGIMGVALCATGSLTLYQYLRKNPALQESVDDQ
jgi:hypothetical protein